MRKALFGGIGKHGVPVALCALFSAFFIGSSVVATSSYSNVIKAQTEIRLAGADANAQVLANGSVKLTFSISVVNPSAYTLHIQSISWFVYLVNDTGATRKLTTLSTDYTGPTVGVTVSKRSSGQFDFQGFVSNRAVVAQIEGFVNYSRSLGHDYTVESVPYDHEFAFIASLGDYEHDYVQEKYLNDLVTVELSYSSEAAP